MAVHVRVKDVQALRQRVPHGRGIEVAARAGISPQRLSQLLMGTAPSIEVEQALRLERALGVAPGTLFEVPKAEVLRHYLTGEAEPDPQAEVPAAPPTDAPTPPATPE